MRIPKSFEIFDASPIRTQEQLCVRGFDEDGDIARIVVNQWRTGSIPDPARLSLNGALAPVRSDTESQILGLLISAPIAPLKDNDARIKFIEVVPQGLITEDKIDAVRHRMIEFVRSDEYEDIATNGIDAINEPWNMLRKRFL